MDKSNKNTGSGKKRFSRRFKIILGIIVSLLVILIAGLAVVGTMLLDEPEVFDVPALTEDSRLRCSQIFEKVMMKAMQAKPRQVAEITLSPEDVNAALDAGGNADNFQKIIFGGKRNARKINYKAEYVKGRFNVVYIADTKIKTPFGSHVKIRFSGSPVITKDDESVTVHQASVGSFDIPVQTVEDRIEKELEKQKSNKYFASARKIIIKAKINKDYSITITYYPYELRQLIAGQFLKSIFK